MGWDRSVPSASATVRINPNRTWSPFEAAVCPESAPTVMTARYKSEVGFHVSLALEPVDVAHISKKCSGGERGDPWNGDQQLHLFSERFTGTHDCLSHLGSGSFPLAGFGVEQRACPQDTRSVVGVFLVATNRVDGSQIPDEYEDYAKKLSNVKCVRDAHSGKSPPNSRQNSSNCN